jgi:hypothetical protein
MNIELGRLPDGGLIIVSNTQFTQDIRRVEYYRDQRLIMLVYDDPDNEGDLMHYELNDTAALAMEDSASIMVIDQGPNRKLHGYDVPLVQIGAL